MNRLKGLQHSHSARIFVMATLLMLLTGLLGTPLLRPQTVAHAASVCQLNSAKGKIQHVIYIQFDNTHFTLDNPNVPSDLDQIPHLLNFIESNGELLSNPTSPHISHTANDILTSPTDG